MQNNLRQIIKKQTRKKDSYFDAKIKKITK